MFYKLKTDVGHARVGGHIEITDENQLKYLVDKGVVEAEGFELNPEIETVANLVEAVNDSNTMVLSPEPTDTKKPSKKADVIL